MKNKTTIYSIRERLGMWLSHRAPWEDYLSLMTCGKKDHIWRSMNGYDPDDCPMCKLESALINIELRRGKDYDALVGIAREALNG